MIQINEMHITVPGSNKDSGTAFGQLVAERLATAIPATHREQHLPEIKLQVQGSASSDPSALADRIVEQIIRQITSS